MVRIVAGVFRGGNGKGNRFTFRSGTAGVTCNAPAAPHFANMRKMGGGVINTHIGQLTGDYGISIEPLRGTVTASRDGQVIARTNAAKVMYETRLAPAIYFPRVDVIADLSDTTGLQTFCPFKGTAHYRDLSIGDHRVANAVWAYDDALPESRGIEGHVGFMPGAGVELDLGDNVLADGPAANISGPMVDWLLRQAWMCRTPEALTAALAEKLVENGVAISRLSILIWSLHPLIAGKNYIWDKATGEVSTFAPSYEIYDNPSFVNSPLMHVSKGLGGVRQKLGTTQSDGDFSIMQDLRAAGATDYVAMPLPFSDGRTNVLTLTCDHPDGFTTANLGLVFECSAVISRYFEVFTQRENARALLETYVGKRTGARVLGGEIRRGDGDDIDAAIMFCDLRGSTRLEEELGRVEYIRQLNDFFEITSDIIHDNGGEVLKFIGDAVLAVFPASTETGDDAAAARRQALQSARGIVARLAGEVVEVVEGCAHPCDCSIGIAYGRVTFGNVGSRERLDFTVIGQAANVAARLGDYGKGIGQRIVVAADVCDGATGVEPLGPLRLHNVSQPVEACAVLPDPDVTTG